MRYGSPRSACSFAFGLLLLTLTTAITLGQARRSRPASPRLPESAAASRPTTLAATRPTSRPGISGERPLLLYIARGSRDTAPIYVVKVDPVTGRFLEMTLEINTRDYIGPPQWRSFAFHPKKPVLYMTTGLRKPLKQFEEKFGNIKTEEDDYLSSVSSFRIDVDTGKLKWMNTEHGKGPLASNVAINEGGFQLYVANRQWPGDFDGREHSINIFPIEPELGAIEPVATHLPLFKPVVYEGVKPTIGAGTQRPPQRSRVHVEQSPTPEWMRWAGWRYLAFPTGSSVLSIQEGGSDAIFVNGGRGDDREHGAERERERARNEGRDRDREEEVEARLKPKRGSNIRHIRLPTDTGASWINLHPDGKYLYVRAAFEPKVRVLELSDDVEQAVEIQSLLIERPERKLSPYGVRGASRRMIRGEMHVHPNGRFLYVSTRDQGLSIFSIDKKTGRLAPAGRGPDNFLACTSFTIDPSGHLLVANSLMAQVEDANTPPEDPLIGAFASFVIDQQTGQLTLADQSPKDFPAMFLRFSPDYSEFERALK